MSNTVRIPFLCSKQILQDFTLFWISYFPILKQAFYTLLKLLHHIVQGFRPYWRAIMQIADEPCLWRIPKRMVVEPVTNIWKGTGKQYWSASRFCFMRHFTFTVLFSKPNMLDLEHCYLMIPCIQIPKQYQRCLVTDIWFVLYNCK